MKKKYKIKVVPKLKEKLRFWWSMYHMIEDRYWVEVADLEKKMAKDTGIDDIEIFLREDNGALGIGNFHRTMPLVHREDLE